MANAFLKWLAFLAGASLATPASAWDTQLEVRISAVELTYVPERVTFWVDRPVGACVGMLEWQARGATQSAKDQNVQAVLSGLLTAKASGASVRIYVATQGCRVEFIHLL